MVRLRNQPGPHGIIQDVLILLRKAFLTPEAVIEEVCLPFDAELAGCPTFPLADRLADFPVAWELEQGMTMVWHQEKDVREPVFVSVPEFDGIQELPRDGIRGKLVCLAVLAADRHKPDSVGRINPGRRLVPKRLSSGMHRKNKREMDCFDEMKME